jgi:hypothetical protein
MPSGTGCDGLASISRLSSAGEGPDSREVGWSASMNALGEFIRAQRQLAKLSPRDMAAMTSVSNAYHFRAAGGRRSGTRLQPPPECRSWLCTSCGTCLSRLAWFG